MALTVTEKIIAAHCGRKEVTSGEIVEAKVDLVLANDITAPVAIDIFRKYGMKSVFDREKIALIPDHFTPNKDIKTAQEVKKMRTFAKELGIKNFVEVGRCGIEHAYLPEQGFVAPGDLVIGADSHTCTYGALTAFSTGVGSTDAAAAMASGLVWLRVPESIKFSFSGKRKEFVYGKDLILYTIGRIGVDGALYKAMEFTGEAIKELSMDSRFSMANMAIEAGGKSAIMAFDEKTKEYAEGRVKRKYAVYESDRDAAYAKEYEFDVSGIEPQVSLPPLPSNTKPVSELPKIEINQAVIGSCTNGRMEDLEVAARILKGKKIHHDVRVVILPATQDIYREAMEKGFFRIFVDAGCSVSTPTCGPCLGGHMGVLAEGEKAISTTNRNFVGRMGHTKSEVYLSNPAVAAASAIKGYICHPDEVKG
jgi:3-isopropylmalate/(R)-2-methylmalate dehydratase large subunit